MKFFKKNPNAVAPVYATEGAAAFDLCAALQGVSNVRVYNTMNREMSFPVKVSNGRAYIQVPSGFRVLVPTGLAFDIPDGYTLDLNIRSGVALKHGITLTNGTGVIDSDYIDEVFAILTNTSDVPTTIYDGERVVQGKIVKVASVALEETTETILPKTSRNGGFGSTGVEAIADAVEEVAEEATEEVQPKRGRGRPPKAK